MSEKFKLAILIGRFQPFHLSHTALLQAAFKTADRVLVILGSHKAARTIKNPFSSEERKSMVLSVLDPDDIGRIAIEAVRDYYYSDTLWVSNVQSIVSKYTERCDISDSEVTLMANYKDESSYYLDLFPQWHKTTFWTDRLDATTVRETMFNTNCGSNDWAPMISSGVAQWLIDNFIGTDVHKQLTKEFQYIESYKRQWSETPYPVTFVTADAVVVKSGHVLMVRRRTEPGKGLLALPGGFIRQNELILDAALRELKEETKIDVNKAVLREKVKESSVFDYPGRSLRGRTVTHAFLIDLGKGPHPKVRGSDDAEAAVWVPIRELYENEDQIFEDHLNIISHFISRL